MKEKNERIPPRDHRVGPIVACHRHAGPLALHLRLHSNKQTMMTSWTRRRDDCHKLTMTLTSLNSIAVTTQAADGAAFRRQLLRSNALKNGAMLKRYHPPIPTAKVSLRVNHGHRRGKHGPIDTFKKVTIPTGIAIRESNHPLEKTFAWNDLAHLHPRYVRFTQLPPPCNAPIFSTKRHIITSVACGFFGEEEPVGTSSSLESMHV